ncbi:hypothetical protein V6N12_062750 [Hibiscus sabdariffa]|uniref:Uncharacterized protein n=1 Tax=Hibiscus sabdariffa TaxID=183260 RepID=A0ABR2F9T3_9ROSI
MDCWLDSEGPLLSRAIGNRTTIHPNTFVADMIDEHGQWRWKLFDRILPCDMLLRIAAVKPPLGVSYDFPAWNDKVSQVNFEYHDSIYSQILHMVEMCRIDPAQNRVTVVISPSGGMAKGLCKLPPGWFKLNTDGAIKRGSNITTCGGVIRDDEGRWRMGFAKRIGICFLLDSKLWGLLEGDTAVVMPSK